MRLSCDCACFFTKKITLNPLIRKGLRVFRHRAVIVRFFAVLNADFRAIKCKLQLSDCFSGVAA